MRCRLPLVLLLVSVMAALTPLAYSDLPDEIWLGGFYDGGDDDSAIVHVQSHLSAIEPSEIYVGTGPALCIYPRLQPYETRSSFRIPSPDSTRAPPPPSCLGS